MKLDKRGLGTGVLAAGLAMVITATFQGCDDDDDYYDDYYDNYYYAYGYYYPGDVMYAMPVYTDYWYGYPYVLEKGATTNRLLPGEVLRQLAAGESVCPDQVTLNVERIDTVCDVSGDGDMTIPIRAEIAFNGCELVDGGVLDGNVLIEATQVFADATCDSNTAVDVSFSGTVTALSYTSVSGARSVIPSLTITGAYTRTLGGPPTTLTASVDGRVERFDPAGDLLMQIGVRGTQTLTPGLLASSGYSIDGSVTFDDTLRSRTVEASATGLTRTDGCCRPTAGTVQLTGSDVNDSWTFGPECGAFSVNGMASADDECF